MIQTYLVKKYFQCHGFSLKCYFFFLGCPAGTTYCEDGEWCVYNEYFCDNYCDCPYNCYDEGYYYCGYRLNMTLPNRPVKEDPKFIIRRN